MTTQDTSPSLPTVQAPTRGKLKPPECAPKRLNYRALVRELKDAPPGTAISTRPLTGCVGAALARLPSLPSTAGKTP